MTIIFFLTKKYPVSQLAKGRLKYYRNLVVSKIRKAKREISMKKIYDNLDDAKKTWQHLNTLIYNRGGSINESCTKLSINSRIITNKILIAEAFNSHFANAAKIIHKKIMSINASNISSTNSFTINIPFADTPISSDEVNILIGNLSNSNAKDVYGISNNLLKIHKKTLIDPLTRVIKNDFESGKFPSSLKIAAITPLFKVVTKLTPIAIALSLSRQLFQKFMKEFSSLAGKNT